MNVKTQCENTQIIGLSLVLKAQFCVETVTGGMKVIQRFAAEGRLL